MRLLLVATFIFLFNAAFMPLLGALHERSHEGQDDKVSITWSEEGAGNGLFQVIQDDHHGQDNSDSVAGHYDSHHCHHVSVVGLIAFDCTQIFLSVNVFNPIEPVFSIQSFPSRIDYPPKNT